VIVFEAFMWGCGDYCACLQPRIRSHEVDDDGVHGLHLPARWDGTWATEMSLDELRELEMELQVAILMSLLTNWNW